MRLTPTQRQQILQAVHEQIGSDAHIWLYGSRICDDHRGGDVDLLIGTDHAVDLLAQATLQARLETELLLPVDISFIDPARGMTRFQRLVAAGALPLEAAP